MRKLMDRSIHINQPEFIERLMDNIFKGHNREDVINKVTSETTTPVRNQQEEMEVICDEE